MEQVAERRVMNSLSLAERLAVIASYNEMPNVRCLARKFNCGRTQIRNILARRHELIEEWQYSQNPDSLPKRRPGNSRLINVFLSEWVQRRHCYPDPITQPMICNMGVEFAGALDVQNFRPNKRWLDRFKSKYKISLPIYPDDPLLNCHMDRKSLDIDDIIRDVSSTTDFAALYPEFKNQDIDAMHFLQTSFDTSSFSGSYSYENSRSLSGDDEDSFEPPEKYWKPDEDVEQDEFTLLPDICPVESCSNPAIISLTSYEDALKHLELLEEFALANENIRVVGLINQIENIFKTEMSKELS